MDIPGTQNSNVSGGSSLSNAGANNTHILNWTDSTLATLDDPAWAQTLDRKSAIRWNQSYPYVLAILRKEGLGYVPSGSYGSFVLPIPPQDMSISTPFAITTTVTLGGVLEEHNAAPLRMISFSGTTGVLPARSSGDMLGNRSTIGAIFAGTISAAKDMASAISALTSSGPKSTNVIPKSDFLQDAGKLTGYFQFRLLQKFLEGYVSLKKKAAGRDYRLCVSVYKDEANYLVTPVQFDLRRSSSSPLEYSYSLSFKAWRRIKIEETPPSPYDRAGPSTRDPSFFDTCLQKLREARTVLQDASDVIRAIGGDVDATVFEPIRQAVYFCKDAVAFPLACIDLPKNIIKDLKSTIVEINSLNRIGMKIRAYEHNANGQELEDLAEIQALCTGSSKSETNAGNLSGSGQSRGAPYSFNMAGGPPALTGALPAVKFIDGDGGYHSIMEAILPSDLNVPPAVQSAIGAETNRIRSLQRIDFERMRDGLQTFSAEFADAIGAGAATYNSQFNLVPRVAVNTRTPTPDEWDVLFAMNDVILEMNRLAASGNINRSSGTSMDYLAGLARGSGIAFTVPTSKYAIPFPYGSTLEMVALRNLGDPQRWMEIAELNGLRTPYVDEEGFGLYLTVCGSGNQVRVADASNLYVNQPVWISSTTVSRTKRHVTKIEQIGNDYVVSVDGDANMADYTTTSLAVLHAFLPNTVNSQQMLYIPSDLPADLPDDKLKAVPGIDVFDPLISVGGIDLLLTTSGDLAMTSDGDCGVGTGLTNIVQKVLVALRTPRGSLIHFPSYGLRAQVGVSVADLDVNSVKQDIQNLLAGDPTFSGVSNVKVNLRGPVLQISFGVTVRGVDQTIPISFVVQR